MKPSYKTKEYIFACIFALVVLFQFARWNITPVQVSILFSVVFNGVMVARSLSKISRGIESTGWGEVQAVAYQSLWGVVASEVGWMKHFTAYCFIAGAIAVYATCRGYTKKMTARSQVFVR